MANFNFNKAIIGGRLTAEPELRTTQSGIPVVSFSVAVSRRRSSTANAGEQQPQADFINVVAWRERAEFVTKYFHKGSSICVVGSIQSRSWTDQNGNKRYATEIVADEVNFVDAKSESAGRQSAPGSQEYGTPSYSNNSGDVAPQFEEMGTDEDLPF